jgi:hypothetical protein
MKTEGPYGLEKPQNKIILSPVRVHVSDVRPLIKLPISMAVDKKVSLKLWATHFVISQFIFIFLFSRFEDFLKIMSQ